MAVAAAPVMTPAAAPARDSRMASARNWVRIWPRVAPSARRSPISERRSSTEMTMMLATPIAPTSSATAPSPRNRVSSAPFGVGPGGERVRRPRDADLAGVFRAGLGAEQVVDGDDGGLG